MRRHICAARTGAGALARAAARSGACLAFGFAAVLFAANVLDLHGLGNPWHLRAASAAKTRSSAVAARGLGGAAMPRTPEME